MTENKAPSKGRVITHNPDRKPQAGVRPGGNSDVANAPIRQTPCVLLRMRDGELVGWMISSALDKIVRRIEGMNQFALAMRLNGKSKPGLYQIGVHEGFDYVLLVGG